MPIHSFPTMITNTTTSAMSWFVFIVCIHFKCETCKLVFFSVPKKLLDNSVLKGNIITSPDMIKVCLIAQNFQIWCKGLGVRGRELRLSTCLLVTNNKSPRIVDSQTKILGANFTSKPFGYEPKNIFCSPGGRNVHCNSTWKIYPLQ